MFPTICLDGIFTAYLKAMTSNQCHNFQIWHKNTLNLAIKKFYRKILLPKTKFCFTGELVTGSCNIRRQIRKNLYKYIIFIRRNANFLNTFFLYK
jgi:hypothetical protein